MKAKVMIVVLILILPLTLAGAALADDAIEFPRWVLSGGASEAAVSGITLRATLGQPLVSVVSGGDVTLRQGFWHGGSPYRIYLPLVLREH